MAVLHIDGRGPVLILVLVDVGLGRADDPESVLNFGSVLILVLVDVGLGQGGAELKQAILQAS